MDRRSFLLAGTAAGLALAAPVYLRAATKSYTPVINGKRVRRKLSTLAPNDPFFAAYAKAVEAMHALPDDDPRSWISQALIHAQFCAHGTMEFFPWHRPYLVNFEKICGALIGDPSFALPYWDWADNMGRMPQPFFDAGPLNVTHWTDNGVYNGPGWSPVNTVPYRWATAGFGLKDSPVAGDFSAQNLQNMEDASTFERLSSLTEGPHGSVHVMVGGFPRANFGTQSGHFSSGLSPLDPIFFLHHANVDRIWAQSGIPVSQQLVAFPDPDKVYAGMFHDGDGNATSPVLKDQFDLAGQDYTYDFLEPTLLPANLIALQQQVVEAQPNLAAFASNEGIRTEAAFAPPKPPIGTSDAAGTTSFGAINTIPVAATGITQALTSQRVIQRNLALMPGALSVQANRIYARFKDVVPSGDSENSLIKVFIDCPYLSDDVPTTDPHYAGVLSFFGCTPDMCARRDFTVDITDPMRYRLQSGTLSLDQVQIQLLAFSDEGSAGKPIGEFGAVELISG